MVHRQKELLQLLRRGLAVCRLPLLPDFCGVETALRWLVVPAVVDYLALSITS